MFLRICPRVSKDGAVPKLGHTSPSQSNTRFPHNHEHMLCPTFEYKDTHLLLYKLSRAGRKSTSINLDFESRSHDAPLAPGKIKITRASGYKSVSLGMFVLPLLHSMGGYVPKVMLEPAVFPQYRYGRHSVEDETTLKIVILGAHLRELLPKERKLWQAIGWLLSLSVINLEEDQTLTI